MGGEGVEGQREEGRGGRRRKGGGGYVPADELEAPEELGERGAQFSPTILILSLSPSSFSLLLQSLLVHNPQACLLCISISLFYYFITLLLLYHYFLSV